MNEYWKDIKGYEGYYQISNLGRVKSLIGWSGNKYIKREKILALYKNQAGYYTVKLQIKNKRKGFRIHRLIAEAFIPNPNNKPEVNHINAIRDDNRIENLEWVTHAENMQHAWKLGTKNNDTIKRKIKCVETGEKFESVSQCAKQLDLNRGNISASLSNDKKVGGLTFEYI